MKGIKYQLKNISKDKMALLSFLLPIVTALVLGLLSEKDLVSATELRFAVFEDNLPIQLENQLSQYGNVTSFHTLDEVYKVINEPSDDTIGVIFDDEIKIIISGDEMSVNKRVADTLPHLLSSEITSFGIQTKILSRPNMLNEFKTPLIALVLVMAMFMSCVFNAMSIIGEKEDGISVVNDILPQTHSQYIIQKIFLGFLCGSITAILTCLIVTKLTGKEIIIMLLLIVFSSLIASLTGLLIGKGSSNLIEGIAYIKVILIVFMAFPMVAYMLIPKGSSYQSMFYFIPSYATFNGIIDILKGSSDTAFKDIGILVVHCMVFFAFYYSFEKCRRKKTRNNL